MDNRQATLELGTKPVGKLLAQYALPAIIAMTASSLYNMIDSIFIGQGVGALAISGLAITFPLMNLSAAFGAAVGIGSSTCISVKLGQKDYKMAEHIFGNSFTLNLVVGVAFGLITLLFLDPILYFFGASENTIPYARDYMLVILAGNVVSQTFLGMNAVLRAASKPKQAMAATILTVILNIVLAPIFIWPLGMGIMGAALATILSQLVALLWQIKLFSNQQEILHFQRGIYKLKSSIVKNITSIGMSPFAMNVCACVVVIFINAGLSHYGGDLAVGAYGIASKVSFIFVMVTIGLNQGMLPIAGYNYGAQRFDRLMRVLKLAMITATAITTTGFVIAEFFPYQCARLFTTDDTLIGLAVEGIRIHMLAIPIVGCQMVITNFFQCIGKAKISIFLSLSRQMLFLLPLLVVLPPIMKVDGVWTAMPISDAVAAIVAFYMMAKYMRVAHETGKEVGIHAHNNLQLAFANTIEAIISGANMVDGTLAGLGRGAGNCPIELLVGFLHNPKYRARPLLECIEKEIEPMRAKLGWGFDYPYMVTGFLNRHPKSAMEFNESDKRGQIVRFYDDMLSSM